ncbi:hypothetical protein PSEUBRA_004890 [Kalmanozyma brasiliensis GHG001]|uniref:uncharacterized protein n=1 Tax=Kalmanozyma brasiliensis (strain GHG001) TaxID=1365824 RepID=UPI002867F204|nr:uncharacterized protein PSEUBRA_004890 [Kalmanozyma brasiliensis GHG001]KAF6767455.1 hypothetical protein PSEUBRA_004890 [Kalmanozyma brasiliensis GHG001]
MSSSVEPTASPKIQSSQTSESNAGVTQTEATATEHQTASVAEKPSLHKCTPLIGDGLVRLTKDFIYSIQNQEHRAIMQCQLNSDSWDSAKHMQTVMFGLQAEARILLKVIEELDVNRDGQPIDSASSTLSCAKCENPKRTEFYMLAQRLANRIDGSTMAYDSHLSFVEMLKDRNEGQMLYYSISSELMRFRNEAYELEEFLLQLDSTPGKGSEE